MAIAIRGDDGGWAGAAAPSWRQYIGAIAHGLAVEAGDDDGLTGEFAKLDLAGARLWFLRSGAQRFSRARPSEGRRFAPMAVFQIEGCSRVVQQSRECVLKPGAFAFIDAARPHMIDHGEPFSHLVLQFPGHAFAPEVFERALGRLDAGDALDHAFDHYVRSLWEAGFDLHPMDHAQAMAGLLSLANLTSPFREARRSAAVPVRVRRAMVFVEHNLGDPELSADGVASAQHVSRRYLDTLFAGCGLGLKDWIWERRLQRAMEGLKVNGERCSGDRRNITQIALAAGFKSASHFSRAFRRRFGMTPREYRAAARGGQRHH